MDELLSCYMGCQPAKGQGTNVTRIRAKVRDSGFYERFVDLGLRLERIFETSD